MLNKVVGVILNKKNINFLDFYLKYLYNKLFFTTIIKKSFLIKI